MSQLDLEMAFAGGREVRLVVQDLVKALFRYLRDQYDPKEFKGASFTRYPTNSEITFPHLRYQEAMQSFGTD